MAKLGLFEKIVRHLKRTSNDNIIQVKTSSKKGKLGKNYSLEEKLQVLKELQDSCAPITTFAKWKGIAGCTLLAWQKQFKEQGEAGLINKKTTIEATLPDEIIQKIITLKQEHPHLGSPKIAQYLARENFINVSNGAILKLLKNHPETSDLVGEKPGAKNKAKYQPKSFERSRPRQMYQMDITPWKLKGLFTVYIIGCIDDYSRFMVSWGIFRRQTSEHCIEVLRSAMEQYSSPPEEVLTDNGRQFYSWRGRNDFQKFLIKAGIKHIRSRAYHPQTLGKIESFWRNMYQELLSRETIANYEDLQEKMKRWIDHYNFKRPHQGIDGMAPADRFFGVDKQMREVMLEGAGMVKDALVVNPNRLVSPMYLIGRIGDKEIRVLARDGSVVVEGVESIEKKNPADDNIIEENRNHGEQVSPNNPAGSQSAGDSISLDQSQDSPAGLPGVGHQQGDLLQVGTEGQVADKSGSRAAETGTPSTGLCTPGADKPGTDPVKTGESKTKEGGQTTAQNQ
jgi:transposase InsO family protein